MLKLFTIKFLLVLSLCAPSYAGEGETVNPSLQESLERGRHIKVLDRQAFLTESFFKRVGPKKSLFIDCLGEVVIDSLPSDANVRVRGKSIRVVGEPFHLRGASLFLEAREALEIETPLHLRKGALILKGNHFHNKSIIDANILDLILHQGINHKSGVITAHGSLIIKGRKGKRFKQFQNHGLLRSKGFLELLGHNILNYRRIFGGISVTLDGIHQDLNGEVLSPYFLRLKAQHLALQPRNLIDSQMILLEGDSLKATKTSQIFTSNALQIKGRRLSLQGSIHARTALTGDGYPYHKFYEEASKGGKRAYELSGFIRKLLKKYQRYLPKYHFRGVSILGEEIDLRGVLHLDSSSVRFSGGSADIRGKIEANHYKGQRVSFSVENLTLSGESYFRNADIHRSNASLKGKHHFTETLMVEGGSFSLLKDSVLTAKDFQANSGLFSVEGALHTGTSRTFGSSVFIGKTGFYNLGGGSLKSFRSVIGGRIENGSVHSHQLKFQGGTSVLVPSGTKVASLNTICSSNDLTVEGVLETLAFRGDNSTLHIGGKVITSIFEVGGDFFNLYSAPNAVFNTQDVSVRSRKFFQGGSWKMDKGTFSVESLSLDSSSNLEGTLLSSHASNNTFPRGSLLRFGSLILESINGCMEGNLLSENLLLSGNWKVGGVIEANQTTAAGSSLTLFGSLSTNRLALSLENLLLSGSIKAESIEGYVNSFYSTGKIHAGMVFLRGTSITAPSTFEVRRDLSLDYRSYGAYNLGRTQSLHMVLQGGDALSMISAVDGRTSFKQGFFSLRDRLILEGTHNLKQNISISAPAIVGKEGHIKGQSDLTLHGAESLNLNHTKIDSGGSLSLKSYGEVGVTHASLKSDTHLKIISTGSYIDLSRSHLKASYMIDLQSAEHMRLASGSKRVWHSNGFYDVLVPLFLECGNKISVSSGGSLVAEGIRVFGRDIMLRTKGDIIDKPVDLYKEHVDFYSRGHTKNTWIQRSTSTYKAKGSVRLISQGKQELFAPTVAANTLEIDSLGGVILHEVHDDHFFESRWKRKRRGVRRSKTSFNQGYDSKSRGIKFIGENTIISSRGDVELVNPYFSGFVEIQTDGSLKLRLGSNRSHTMTTRRKSGVLWFSNSAKGREKISYVQPYFERGLKVGAERVVVQSLKGDKINFISNIDPLKIYREFLDNETHHYYSRHRGPTREFSAAVAIAVAIATAGTGSSLGTSLATSMGHTTATSTAAATTALTTTGMVIQGVVAGGITALTTSAALATLSSDGHIKRAGKRFFSSQTVNNTLRSAATAGLSRGLCHHLEIPSMPKGMLEHVSYQSILAGVNIAVGAVSGDHPDSLVKSTASSFILGTIGAKVAEKIGEIYGQQQINPLTHKVLHGFWGGVMGSLSSDDPARGALAGAFGAFMAEIFAEQLAPEVPKGGIPADQVDHFKKLAEDAKEQAKVLVVMSVLILDKDVSVAHAVGANAVDHNFLPGVILAIEAAGVAYEIYGLYQTYMNEGKEAAAKQMLIDAGLSAVTLGIGTGIKGLGKAMAKGGSSAVRKAKEAAKKIKLKPKGATKKSVRPPKPAKGPIKPVKKPNAGAGSGGKKREVPAEPRTSKLQTNLADTLRHTTELTFMEAGLLDKTGKLTEKAIQGSYKIKLSDGIIKNPKVVKILTNDGSRITDWAKFKTAPVKMRNGQNREIHYYKHTSGKVDYLTPDFKVKGDIKP